jgi:hypothetical protein
MGFPQNKAKQEGTVTSPAENNDRTTQARRPTVEEVVATLLKLETPGTVPAIVAALRRETGCSRATAYRAVSDAFAAGEIERNDA